MFKFLYLKYLILNVALEINKEFWKMKFTPNPSFIFQNKKIKFIINEENLSIRWPKIIFWTHFATLHSGHITRDMRFGARLAPHPNFAPFHFAKLRISLTLCSMPIFNFVVLAHPWARVDLYGKQLNKYVMYTEKNDSKGNISTIVFIPLFWRYKNNEYIQS